MIEYKVRLKNLSQKGKDVKRSLFMRSQFKSMRAIFVTENLRMNKQSKLGAIGKDNYVCGVYSRK